MVQEYADHLPGALAQDPSQLGAWLYSCEEASHDEGAAMARTMPDLPLQVRDSFCGKNCWAVHRQCLNSHHIRIHLY